LPATVATAAYPAAFLRAVVKISFSRRATILSSPGFIMKGVRLKP
jgi:hypothetical protein